MNWQNFIFDPSQKTFDLMESIAYKRFYDQELADAAFNYCLDKLSKNNWAKLNQYSGKNSASPTTFFARVYTNLVEDYARTELGRCDAPSWLKKLGQTWKKVFTLLCCHGKSTDVVLDVVTSDFNSNTINTKTSSEANTETENILTIINTIKNEIPDCGIQGKRTTKVALDDDDENSPEVAIALSTPHTSVEIEKNEFYSIIKALFGWSASENKTKNLATSNALQLELRSLALDDEIIVLFRCMFQENMSLPDAAKFVGIKAHTARRKRADIFSKIKQILIKHHIDLYNL